MGLDGGTIATRSDLLRRSSWRLTNADGGEHRSTRGGQLGSSNALATSGVEKQQAFQATVDLFSTCSLSGAVLPTSSQAGAIVACALGRLYLRNAVMEYLAKTNQFEPGMCDTSMLDAAHSHIQRVRDVFPVQLEANPLRDSTDEGGGGRQGPWVCPVDHSKSTNGQHRFVALRPCVSLSGVELASPLPKP
jgi:hypothetical protein